MGPYLSAVKVMLKSDETAPPKQRHTAGSVCERLVEEHGYAGSEVTARRAVRRLRGRQVEMSSHSAPEQSHGANAAGS
jgi:hypothetical protein